MDFKELYQRMFEAKERRDDSTANVLMIQMEELRRQTCAVPSPELIAQLGPDLGPFVRANCLNTAFNFHDLRPRHDPAG